MKSSLGHKNANIMKSLGSKFQHSNSIGTKGNIPLATSISANQSILGDLTDTTTNSNSVNTQNMPVGLKRSHLEKR